MTGSRPHLRLEKELLRGGVQRLAAMDEVGRGALAGPVSVGVVVVTARIGRVPLGLRDSKLLTPQAREVLLPVVRRWAGEFAVGHASPDEIDAVGIIGALRLAGRRALAQLREPVDAVLLDGNHDYLSDPEPALFAESDLLTTDEPEVPLPVIPAPAQLPPVIGPVFTRIKADLTCAGVAGASVLAKTERDGLLRRLALEHPEYLFEVNKGYGTAEHIAALRRYGPSQVHRRSWRLPLGELGRPGEESPGVEQAYESGMMGRQELSAGGAST
ncbi:ribonuclease HII [Nakamurella sp. UYEF19]|uniref:ribonuclease HII n=1 Tax=Nakamurella sp. UYEF19 TaxID=1756392 RepID=UPI003394A1AB